MISFIISLVALIAGYFLYGRLVDRAFGPDDRPTPAVAHPDGVDFVVMPSSKVFMIQFLNIAGTGPIFGAIMGMWFGTSAYLWIVLGCIFAGAVHDYFTGMLSVRHDGASLPELAGLYLGRPTRRVVLVFTVIILMMVGVVFVYSPAIILSTIWGSRTLWIAVIFAYYVIATLLPIDKIIGKIYPLFAFSLLFMAAALMVGLFVRQPHLPELWEGLGNLGAERFGFKDPIFPALFVTIACGAISGFHATQSPLMARCMRHERQGRAIFYGAMITEGLVALIWATVSSYFFYDGGWREVCSPEVVASFTGQSDKTLIQYFDAPMVVKSVCSGWLGVLGGILALLGVVAAPITSGDTAFRSARLIIAEAIHFEQRSIPRRLAICIPLFALAVGLLFWQIENPDGFNIIWKYFGWSNQTLAVFSLWIVTVYLVQQHKCFYIALVPAVLMTSVCATFLFVSPQALGLAPTPGYALGMAVTVVAVVWFAVWYRRQR